jgi:hypothetical protein
MKLEDFGYNDKLEKFRVENNLAHFEIGRVIAEHKERYVVKTENGNYEAEGKGKIDEASYENYLKMEREKAHFKASVVERRKKDKEFGKMLKNYKKSINKNKY